MADVSHQETKSKSKMLPASQRLRQTLKRAESYALKRNHSLLQLDHVLLALLEDEDALKVLESCFVDNQSLRQDMLAKVGPEAIQTQGDQPSPVLEKGFDEVLLSASLAARQSGRREISGANILAAVISSKRGFSVSAILEHHGLTYNNIMRILSGGGAAPTVEETFLGDRPTQPSPGRADLPAMGQSQTHVPNKDSQSAGVPREAAVGGAQSVQAQPSSTIPAVAQSLPPELNQTSAKRLEETPDHKTVEQAAVDTLSNLGAKIEAQSASLNQRLASQELEEPANGVAFEAPNTQELQHVSQQTTQPINSPKPNADALPSEMLATNDILVSRPQGHLATNEPHPPMMPNMDLAPTGKLQGGGAQSFPASDAHRPTPAMPVDAAQYRAPERTQTYAQSVGPDQNKEMDLPSQKGAASFAPQSHDNVPYPVGEISSPSPFGQRKSEPPLNQPRRVAMAEAEPVQYTVQNSPDESQQGFQPSNRHRVAPVAPRHAPPANLAGQRKQADTGPHDEKKFQEIADSIKYERSQQLITPREQFVDNIPTMMKIGKVEQIEVRLPRHTEEEIRNSMSRNGDRQGQVSRVSKALTVHLRGSEDMFIIENRSPSTHWVEHANGMIDDNDYAVWRWKIMPTRKGPGILEITSTVRFVDDQVGVGAEMPLSPMKSYDVGIKRNYKSIFTRILWALLAVGVGIALMPLATNAVAIFKKLTNIIF